MLLELESPFKEVWCKGYLRASKDNRKRVDLYNSQKDRTTISYARYLVCIKLGHILCEDFEVDHKDKDKTNDNINNLQVLSKEEHKRKTVKEITGRTVVELVCPNCNALFRREKRNIKPNTLPKCSRRCNGLFNSKSNLWLGRTDA